MGHMQYVIMNILHYCHSSGNPLKRPRMLGKWAGNDVVLIHSHVSAMVAARCSRTCAVPHQTWKENGFHCPESLTFFSGCFQIGFWIDFWDKLECNVFFLKVLIQLISQVSKGTAGDQDFKVLTQMDSIALDDTSFSWPLVRHIFGLSFSFYSQWNLTLRTGKY